MNAIRLLLVSFLVLCVSTANVVASGKSKQNSVTDQTYPQAQAEIEETFGAIAESIVLGAGKGADSEYMDRLISFHAYGPKFTEFNDGELYDSEGNELNERTLFGTVVDEGGVVKFAYQPGTFNIAVYYGNVANVTFISDFELMIVGDLHPVKNLISLLFVKTKGEWKIVHEHHSPASE